MSPTLTPEDFSYIRELIYREAALVLEPGKEYLVSSRLEPIARAEKLEGIPGLVKSLRNSLNNDLRDKVVDAMTTNETLWFRDTHPFDSLRDSIIPELIKANQGTKTLKIWCAAASTGQEPYSLAMLLKENFSQLSTWNVSIVGTDISASALEKAKAGQYNQMEIGRGLPAQLMVKYFTRSGINFLISPAIRQMITFKPLNLAGVWSPMGPFDLIMMRNVLIYFNHQTKTDIIAKAFRLVKDTGYLMLGSTESLLSTPNDFVRVTHGKTTCYAHPNNPMENK